MHATFLIFNVICKHFNAILYRKKARCLLYFSYILIKNASKTQISQGVSDKTNNEQSCTNHFVNFSQICNCRKIFNNVILII